MCNHRSKRVRFLSACSTHLASAGGVKRYVPTTAISCRDELLESLLSQGGIMLAPKHAIYIRASCDQVQMSHPGLLLPHTQYNFLITMFVYTLQNLIGLLTPEVSF